MLERCSECGEPFHEDQLEYGMCSDCASPGNPAPYDGEHDCSHDWERLIAYLESRISNGNEEDRGRQG